MSPVTPRRRIRQDGGEGTPPHGLARAVERLRRPLLAVVGAGALVVANVAGVGVDVLAAGHALALALGVEPLLVTARVLGRVRHSVDAARRRDFLRMIDQLLEHLVTVSRLHFSGRYKLFG